MDERTIVPILSKFRHFSMLLQFILNRSTSRYLRVFSEGYSCGKWVSTGKKFVFKLGKMMIRLLQETWNQIRKKYLKKCIRTLWWHLRNITSQRIFQVKEKEDNFETTKFVLNVSTVLAPPPFLFLSWHLLVAPPYKICVTTRSCWHYLDYWFLFYCCNYNP
jgi:hypothetical protein